MNLVTNQSINQSIDQLVSKDGAQNAFSLGLGPRLLEGATP